MGQGGGSNGKWVEVKYDKGLGQIRQGGCSMGQRGESNGTIYDKFIYYLLCNLKL